MQDLPTVECGGQGGAEAREEAGFWNVLRVQLAGITGGSDVVGDRVWLPWHHLVYPLI